jgi:hypothetical protein
MIILSLSKSTVVLQYSQSVISLRENSQFPYKIYLLILPGFVPENRIFVI